MSISTAISANSHLLIFTVALITATVIGEVVLRRVRTGGRDLSFGATRAQVAPAKIPAGSTPAVASAITAAEPKAHRSPELNTTLIMALATAVVFTADVIFWLLMPEAR